MGAPEIELWSASSERLAAETRLAACLLAMTQFVEQPCGWGAQRIVCLLDCLAEDTTSDAATRAIATLLAQRWMFGAEAGCEAVLQPARTGGKRVA